MVHMEKPIPQAHLFPPEWEHGDSYILANRSGLMRLLEVIQSTLAGGVSRTVVYAGDGEGYDLYVALVEEGLSSDSPPYMGCPRKEGRPPHVRVRQELARRGLSAPISPNTGE